MGELVRQIGEGVPPNEPAEFLDRIEALCEVMREDREEGADCTVNVNVKARGKGGWIPRGLGQIVNDAHHVIPLLVAEMRRREADPFRATTVDAVLESFVRWIDSLPFEDFQRVTAFVDGRVGSRQLAVVGSDTADRRPSTADLVEEWGVEDEVGELGRVRRGGDTPG